MKYKIGDKVKIKTWEQLKKECLISDLYKPSCWTHISHEMENELKKIDRIVTIIEVDEYRYKTAELGDVVFSDPVIECLLENYVKLISIQNRFEILDL